MISNNRLREFLIESNRIEGFNGYSIREFDEARKFLDNDIVTVDSIVQFVLSSESGARFRNKESVANVRIGSHTPPPSGARVVTDMDWLVECANLDRDPFIIHRAYQECHPFTDCNGRSGRLLWLWQMILMRGYNGDGGFLRPYYFQSLGHIDGSVI